MTHDLVFQRLSAFQIAALGPLVEPTSVAIRRRNVAEVPQHRVVIDPRYQRPTEVDVLIGDAAKARKKLDWAPTVCFKELVEMMVDADMELAAREKRSK